MLTARAPRVFRLAIPTVFACAVIVPLVGCSGLSVSASAPAFVKDVDTLRSDHDAAIAQVRSDLGGSIDQLRADVVAARSAGEKAFADAIASGKSIGEATADRVRAETAVAIQAAQDALKKQKVETDAAIAVATAKAKAAQEAARQSGEGSPGWLTWVLGLLGTTGAGGILAKILLILYDRKPFVGSDGTAIAEGPLVDAARALLGATKRASGVSAQVGPPTSTPPAS